MLLRSGALAAGSLALGGPWVPPAAAATPAETERVAGPVLAWLVYDPDRGGAVRLVEFADGQAAREFAAGSLPLLTPAAASRHAQELAVRTVAATWNVSQAACEVRHDSIAHPASGRTVGYRLWVDFV
jgi:hypothetical protein